MVPVKSLFLCSDDHTHLQLSVSDPTWQITTTKQDWTEGQ